MRAALVQRLALYGRQQPVLDGVDSLLERLARLERELLLAQDRAGVEALVDEVDRDARGLHIGCERLLDRVRAREVRQERGVNVDDAFREAIEERLRQEVHVAREHDELDAVLLEPRRHHEVALLAVVVAVEADVAVGTPAARARTSAWASLRLEATAVTGSRLS